MQIVKNMPLDGLNTFGLSARAEHFAEAFSEADVLEAIATGIRPILVLGGGSNLLFTKETVGGLALKNSIGGREVVETQEHHAVVRVGGGEIWHEAVMWSIELGLSGLENMALIPGTVGAAPIQNIGAYGAELKDRFRKLEAIDLQTGEKRMFSREECRFGYRDSFFKREGRGKWLISAVWLTLLDPDVYAPKIGYAALREALAAQNIARPSPRQIAETVIAIRRSKLPDPAQIGNAGSFFKNPTIERLLFEKLKAEWPEMPHFDQGDEQVKIPAGWLIERCGWKGRRLGSAGCYEKQALVLVNFGGATGSEVWLLAQKIIASVEARFGIRLEPEVNVL